MPRTSSKEVVMKTCCRCGRSYPLEKNFMKTSSDLFMGTERFPMCNLCIHEIYDLYLFRFNNPCAAIKRLCMIFDIYYDESLAESCSKNENKVMTRYVQKINSMAQYKNKSFDSSLIEGISFKMPNRSDANDYSCFDNDTIHPEDVQQWGDGLSASDYRALNNHYNFLKNANPNCDSNQEIFIIDLCYIKMQQMKAIRESRPDDYSKMAEQYRKSFSQAGLKTVRDTSADEDFTLGVNIEMIEKFTPAEYYKDKELFKDIDSIGDYITRFITRPLRNLQFGTTDRDHEYYIKDEETANEYNDD